MDIILADKAPRAVAAIILSEGVLDVACAGVRKVGADVAFTCDKVATLNAINKY